MTSTGDESLEQLQLQLSQLKQRIEEAERKQRERNEIVTFSSPSLKLTKINIKMSPFKKAISDFFHDMGLWDGVGYNYIECDVDFWRHDLYPALLNRTDVKIEFTEAELHSIQNHVKPPDVYIKLSNDKHYIIFDITSKAPTQPLFKYTEFNHNHNKYVMGIHSLYNLSLILDMYKEKYSKSRVVLEPELQTLLDEEMKKRKELEDFTNDDGSSLPPIHIGGVNLRSFQLKGVEFLKRNDGNGIIAFDMGLGKTATSLAFADWYWKNVDEKQKFIVVGPASLRPNWSSEIRRYLNIQVYHLTGTSPSSTDMTELMVGQSKIFYANYDMFARNVSALIDGEKVEKGPWNAVITLAKLRLILDEAHYIKSMKSSRTRALHQMSFKSSCLLTGTPMKNGPGELFPLLKLVNGETFAVEANFLKDHTSANGRYAKDPKNLHEILRPYMYRVRKQDVIKDLPPINRFTLEHELSPTAKKAYNLALQDLYVELESVKGYEYGRIEGKEINNLLVQLMRMKQIVAADKVDFIAERAVDTYDNDDSEYNKVIIFTQFSKEPPLVGRIAARLGNESVSFTGENEVFERQRIVDRFQNEDDIHFLVASTKAASEGLNITKAGHVIFTDLMWTPADHAQAENRAYGRLSELHTITSTYVIAKGTVEDQISSILMQKLNVISSVLEGTDYKANESVVKELFGELKNLREV